jgi:hypothetical protein
MGNQPATLADVRLITGDQGQGKSTIAVGFIIDAYYSQLNAIVSPNGEKIKSSPLSENDKKYLRKVGVYPNALKYVRIYSENEQSKIIKVPRNFMVLSPVKLFTNFHLYGVRYVRHYLADIVENINTDLYDDAWVVLDESSETNSRRSMEALNKLAVESFFSSIRKRKSHLITIAQFNRQLEVMLRLFQTMSVTCSFDKNTNFITAEISKRGEPPFSVDVYGHNYWRFFKSDEKILARQDKLDRALAPIYKSVR